MVEMPSPRTCLPTNPTAAVSCAHATSSSVKRPSSSMGQRRFVGRMPAAANDS
jgi:hypothetical protein